MIKMLKVTSVIATLVIISAPTLTYGAGHFTLAFQRQLSAWENSSAEGCMGGHVCRVWVWDEDGNPIPNIDLYTTWDVLMGATDIDGRAEIPIWSNDFDLKCVDGHGATSDSTRLMTTHRPECWGHYSFEVGFLYKTDLSNPGEFDLDLHCTWNERDPAPQDNDAPYTKSLAYSGVDCTDYWSDRSDLGKWQTPPSYFGQTFIATGDRVVAARVHGVIGGNNLLDWKLRIVTFPGLQPVGEETSVPVQWPFGWEAFWGVNDCPVNPGQTYMLQAWREGDGMNMWRVEQDVYPHGQYYEGTTAYPGLDLNGHICCMTYGSAKGPDLNEDGRIDFKDYCKLAEHWQQESTTNGASTLNNAGKMDYTDLSSFVDNWLTATTIPPLPEQASNPNPSNGALGVSSSATLSWTAGSGATSHDVYIGTSNPPPFIINLTTTTISPGWFNPSTTFYWRIDENNSWGKTTGQIWEFTTAMTPPPPPPPPPP